MTSHYVTHLLTSLILMIASSPVCGQIRAHREHWRIQSPHESAANAASMESTQQLNEPPLATLGPPPSNDPPTTPISTSEDDRPAPFQPAAEFRRDDTTGVTPASGEGPAEGGEGLTESGLTHRHGQTWRTYDISPYTKEHRNKPKPQQLIVDWILRETGTEIWFSRPMGILSADNESLRMYQTPEIHKIAEPIINRFLSKETKSHVFGIRLVTLTSPNWRTKAYARMQPVKVQSPGVEAWLISREDAAVMLGEVRKRSDFREHSSPNLLIRNGDSHTIQKMRPIAYTRAVRSVPTTDGTPASSFPDVATVNEGFELKISPLMTVDGTHADAIVKMTTHQVENMKKVSVPAPSDSNPRQMASIEVPQTSSWKLHERFHWPADQILVVSCGVVASPGPDGNRNSLGIPRLFTTPPRADAILIVDAKGRSSDWMTDRDDHPYGPAADLKYRGRY